MKLHRKYARALGAACALYALLFVYVFVVSADASEAMGAARWVAAALPFYCLVALGSYLLFRLGRDIFTFRDYPDERAKLEQDIAEAKKDLAQRGFQYR